MGKVERESLIKSINEKLMEFYNSPCPETVEEWEEESILLHQIMSIENIAIRRYRCGIGGSIIEAMKLYRALE